MAQNFLYMFEFVVDDLLVTRPNYCAPEEYPTCVEITFRSSVFINICDREFGCCPDPCGPRCGKCCIFSLESPVTKEDRLLVHIYKKKTEACKFLIGAADLAIKPLFDKVTESFNIENPNWMEVLAKHQAQKPNPKNPPEDKCIPNECDEEGYGRKEQMCPTNEMTKRLLPLFNMKNVQTGNLVLIIRLVCNGPAIVSTFSFNSMCSAPCPKKCASKKPAICSERPHGGECQPSDCPPTCPQKGRPVCALRDPCEQRTMKALPCQRYFACNRDKGCPCEECEDYCDRECPTVKNCKQSKSKKQAKGSSCCPPPPQPRCSSQPRCPPPQSGCPPPPCKKQKKEDPLQRLFKSVCQSDSGAGNGEECMDECEADEECEDEESGSCCCMMKPCFIQPTRPDPGPEAYEEFEACLNGSGIVIRVLKDTHQVESINDGVDPTHLEESTSEADRCGPQPCVCESLTDLMKRSTFARTELQKRTGGKITNHPGIPKIRANIKYAGNEDCCADHFRLPLGAMKGNLDRREDAVNIYRRCGGAETDCDAVCPAPLPPVDTRNTCMQVTAKEIKDTLKGINADTRKKGIEVCYKTCEDTESDVFLVKLGSKQKSQVKRSTIEIELKTPKQASTLPKQKCTVETQIDEVELDAALTGRCKGKKKGKKGKKGKGKKKK